MRLRLIAAICMALALAACSTTRTAVVETGPRYTEDTTDQAYRLDSGDKVRLTVYNEPTLSGEFAVSSNGSLSLPLIGEVPATKRTTDEIGAEVQRRLADGYLRDPKVSMEVITYRPFFILGEVKAPGQYPFASGITVLNAVATAQGFSPRAERKVAYIRRAGSTEETPYRLTPDLRVQPGDTIRIGERYF